MEHISVDDAVCVVALDDHGRVAIVEDDFYLQRRRVQHLPGGGSAGQEPQQAARRELEEETGVLAGTLHPLGVIDPLPVTTSARIHLFDHLVLRGRNSIRWHSTTVATSRASKY